MSPPGCRPPFLKPKFHKESKNGFKPINYRPPLLVIFSKNYFRKQKSSKKMDVFFIFIFFLNICAQVRPVLKNLIAGLPESLEKLERY
jgi:hypothetical protein